MFFGSKVEKKIKTGGCIDPRSLSGERSSHSWKLFSKTQKNFKNASPKTLCSLVGCETYTPSEVLGIMPEATAEQLAKFFDLLEERSSSKTSEQPTIVLGKEEKDLNNEAKPVDASAGQVIGDRNQRLLNQNLSLIYLLLYLLHI